MDSFLSQYRESILKLQVVHEENLDVVHRGTPKRLSRLIDGREEKKE
jgi:hypothetical protein